MATPKQVEEFELRGMIPRDLIDVLDAVRHARGMTRIALVLEILEAWKGGRVHEATLIHRVLRGNPLLSDDDRSVNP